METFRVGTLNVNGVRNVRKHATFYEMSKVKRIDVLFVQETHSDRENETDWRTELEGSVILSHNTTTSTGVGFLFSGLFLFRMLLNMLWTADFLL